MLRIVCVLLLFASLGRVCALSIGDDALELKSKYYNGRVFKAKFYMVDKKNQKKLKKLKVNQLKKRQKK